MVLEENKEILPECDALSRDLRRVGDLHVDRFQLLFLDLATLLVTSFLLVVVSCNFLLLVPIATSPILLALLFMIS